MKIKPILTFIMLSFVFFTSCKKENTNSLNPGTTDHYGSPFAGVPATEDIIMYEVNLRAFSSGGNLQGVIDKLDSLKKMAVNVVWLMPIQTDGQLRSVNSPYCIKDYKAVSPEYGTLEDLRKLTDKAHEKGIAVIMDWVANHTSWDNSWVANKAWYSQDGSGNIIIPPGTNWQDVADLNFNNADMRLAMIDAMKYWILQANVDGFRCDYADGVPYDFWKQAWDSLRVISGRNYILLAEGNRSDHFSAGFNMNFGWNFYNNIKNVFAGSQIASTLYTTGINEYLNVPVGKHKLRFTTNHDESAWDNTPMVLFNGKEGSIAASVITTFLGGVPLIYTGQEVGTVNTVPFFSKSTINWSGNPDMKIAYQQMMNFYSVSAAARKGSCTDYSDNSIVCFKKTYNTSELLILVNTKEAQINFTIPSVLQNTTWSDAFTNNIVTLGNTQLMNNYQYLILKK